MKAKQWFLCLSILAILASVLFWRSDSLSPSGASGSPLPTPPLLPTPTPAPVPECHALAIAHVAREHGIPQDRLLAGSCYSGGDERWVCDGHEEWFEFPLTQQKACAVRVWTKDGDESYGVAVSEQGKIVDLAALRAQERAAGVAQCGKLDPVLCARWSALADDEEVEVGLWLTSPDVMAIFDAVAAGYPPSLQPVPGAPFDIGHPDYEKAFSEVEQLMRKAQLERAEPVLSALKAMGARDMGTVATAPVVFARLSKQAISTLSARDDISTIYLLEGQFEDAMDSVAGTIRASPFWSAGNTGSGIRVAVVEDDPIDFSNPYLDHANGGTGPPEFGYYLDLWEHATAVAGVIAMKDHPIYQGVAPDVTLISADVGNYYGSGAERRIITATDWALNAPNYADVVNCSFGGSPGLYDLVARYYDYVVRWLRRTVVPAAGNTGQDVQSPATAYNVISVGGFDDKDTAGWSDDEMWASSSYLGPGAREKPEVVAVSNGITTTSHTHPLGYKKTTDPGTSFAAPQVSGLAALLMQETLLFREPELIKAVIMASAAHNVKGTTPVNNWDGVGGIDAAMAKALVDHGKYGVAPEGWYDYRTVYESSFDGNGYLHYYVPLTRGEKIRIALVYDSHPDVTDPWNTDELDSNLNLYVYRGSSPVAMSSYYSNNFEFVEYTATKTDTYDVRVKKESWNANFEYIGIAWAKMATYLPDVKVSDDGWDSEIITRNDSSDARDVVVALFEPDGHEDGWVTIYGIPSGGRHVFNPPTPQPEEEGFSGPAIVDGSEDVSVVVETRQSGTGATAAYPGLRPHEAATRLGLPLIFHIVPSAGHYWDTEIVVHNPNADPASVTVTFYPGEYPPHQNIPANGSHAFSHYATGFFGSAVLSSDQPVVTVVREYATDQVMASAYPALLPSTAPIQLPLLFKQIYSQGEYWNTSFHVQNLGDSSTDLTITYVCEFSQNPGGCSGGDTCVKHAWALGPNEAFGFDQRYHLDGCGWDTFFGSAKVESSSEPIAVAVNQRPLNGSGLTNRLGTYVGVGGDKLARMPRLQKDAGGWSTSVAVRNAGAQDATIFLYYYDAAGNPVGTPHSETIEAEGMANIDQRYDTVLNGVNSLDGSGVLVSDQPVAVVVNRRHDPPGDNLCSYNGLAP